jgi:protein associated with RNAse G/E
LPTLQLHADNEIPLKAIDYNIDFNVWEKGELMLFIKKYEDHNYEYMFRFSKLEVIFLRDFLSTLIENT